MNNIYDFSPNTNPTQNISSKKRNPLIIILIIIGAVFLLGIIIYVAFYFWADHEIEELQEKSKALINARENINQQLAESIAISDQTRREAAYIIDRQLNEIKSANGAYPVDLNNIILESTKFVTYPELSDFNYIKISDEEYELCIEFEKQTEYELPSVSKENVTLCHDGNRWYSKKGEEYAKTLFADFFVDIDNPTKQEGGSVALEFSFVADESIAGEKISYIVYRWWGTRDKDNAPLLEYMESVNDIILVSGKNSFWVPFIMDDAQAARISMYYQNELLPQIWYEDLSITYQELWAL